MGVIGGVIPMLLILIFGCGIAWAGTFCKTTVSKIIVGIALGFGILFVLVGVVFAGCCLVLAGSNGFH
jgi:hypothetical protein